MNKPKTKLVSHSTTNEKIIDSKIQKMIVDSFNGSKKRLLLLDYDGVLRSFVKSQRAEDAEPSKKIYDILDKLSSQPNTELCIISGRKKDDLIHWFNNLDATLVAEHGAWIKSDSDWQETYSSFCEHRDGLLKIMKKYAKRTAGAVVEEKNHSIVWHYRQVKTDLAYAINANLIGDLERELVDTDMKVHSGNMIIEVKPNNINKGIVAKKLFDEHDADFVICIGDDYTDEDMFKVLPEQAFTIKVGQEDTQAMFSVRNVAAVHNLLEDFSNN